MAKNKLKVVGTLLCVLLSSCSPKTKSLSDFSDFSNLRAEDILKIQVDWDINENAPVEFDIEDKKDIKFIVDILFDKSTFVFQDKEKVNGGHSNIALIDKENNESRVHLTEMYDGKNRYTYKDTTLYDYIYNLGVDLGVLN